MKPYENPYSEQATDELLGESLSAAEALFGTGPLVASMHIFDSTTDTVGCSPLPVIAGTSPRSPVNRYNRPYDARGG